MPVKNRTRKTIISKDMKTCRSLLCQFLGVMFRRSSYLKDRVLIFELAWPQHVTLHMFFVFFAIDIIYLDAKRRVVRLKENFLPFTVFVPGKIAKYIIECEKGTIKKTGTKVGDRIDF